MIGARHLQHVGNEIRREQPGTEREAKRRRRTADDRGAQAKPPVVEREPDERDQRNGDEVVLDEARQHHHQHGRLDRAAFGVKLEKPREPRRHHGEPENLRLVHADVEFEEPRHCGNEPEARDQLRGARAAELPHDDSGASSDAERSQQRQRAPDIDRVAEQTAEPADQIVGERRVVIGDEALGRRVQPTPPHRGVDVIGIPALVAPDLQRQECAPYRPDQKQRRQRGNRPHQSRDKPHRCGRKRSSLHHASPRMRAQCCADAANIWPLRRSMHLPLCHCAWGMHA